MTTSPEPRPIERPIEIERRSADDLSYDEFHRDYVMANRPLVIEDVATGWPALGKWTPEYFKAQFGSRQVQVSIEEKMAFADFIDAVLASSDERPGPYMYRLYFGTELPELLRDLRPNPYSYPGRLASPLMPRNIRRPDGYFKLLIGGAGGGFPMLHFDAENHHACVTQLHGEKLFVLFPPGDSRWVYADAEHENWSGIPGRDVFFPNYEAYPLLANATRHEAVARPGAMVFIPCRWWHITRVLSTSISVCQNVLDRSNWEGFVRWSTLPRENPSVLKRVGKRAYLKALGRVMSSLEAP